MFSIFFSGSIVKQARISSETGLACAIIELVYSIWCIFYLPFFAQANSFKIVYKELEAICLQKIKRVLMWVYSQWAMIIENVRVSNF